MRAWLVVRVLALVSFVAFRGCFGGASTSWNQRLTLVVETPQGEVRGSAVSAISWRKHWSQWVVTGWSYDVTGEAVVVEVTRGHFLLALMKGTGTTEYMGSVAPAAIAGREGRGLNLELFSELLGEVDYRSSRATGVIPVPEVWYPMLVTFDDITKPETVREVDPADLGAVFGEGVRLKAVTLEITEEAVTEGRVEGVLGWLGPYPEPGLCPSTGGLLADAPFCRKVHIGDFIRRP